MIEDAFGILMPDKYTLNKILILREKNSSYSILEKGWHFESRFRVLQQPFRGPWVRII